MDASFYMAASAVLVALVTGYFTWVQSWPKGTDIQAALNASFKLIINEVKGENSRLREDVASIRQSAQRTESQMRAEIEALWTCVGRHERLLTLHGIPFERFKYEQPSVSH